MTAQACRRLSVILALLLASCGDRPAAVVDDGLAWHVTKRTPPLPGRGRVMVADGGELMRNTWPEARHAREDHLEDDPVYPLLVVNVFSDGVAHLKGMTYNLMHPQRGHRNEFEDLREELEVLVGEPEWWDAEGNNLSSLMLGVHRETQWDRVRDLLSLALADTVRIRQVQWTVNVHGARQRHRHEARVTPVEGTGRGWNRRLGLSGELGGWNEVVTLRLDARTWQFHRAWSDFNDPVFVARANSIWSEVEDALGGRGSAGVPVALDLPVPAHGVTWAHVVTVFDLLLGAGYRVVDLPVQGWRFTFSEPGEGAR